MKYIKENEKGITSYDDYFNYIESIRDKIGEELYSFSSDHRRYDLSSKGSLHDSWIKSLRVSPSYIENSFGEDADVVIELVGPYHDRVYSLNYYEIEKCDLSYLFVDDDRKKDLLIHELRFEDGLIEHELFFDAGMSIIIRCKNMTFDERLK